MLYGPVNAPAVFQAFIKDVLGDMLGKFVICLDDILISSNSLNLLDPPYFSEIEKCKFHKSSF